MRRRYGTSWAVALGMALALGSGEAACSDTSSDGGTSDGGATTSDASSPSDAAPSRDSAATADASATTDAASSSDASSSNDSATTTDGSAVATWADIVLNEVQSQETTGTLATDFVELYNRSPAPFTFAAGEWKITDSDPTHVLYIPGGTTIAGRGFLVLLTDEATVPTTAPLPPAGALACTQDGTNSAPFGLGGTDAVSLYFTGAQNPSPGTAVDATSWATHVKTRARFPDGDAWSNSDVRTPTPGAKNE